MSKGTILVNLQRDWFAPDGSLYLVRDNPHEFPASWEDQVPRIKVPKEKAEAAPPTEYVVDEEARDRIIVSEGDSKTVAVLQNTANGEQLVTATAVDADVKAVGGALDDKGNEQPSQTIAKAEAGAEEANVTVGGRPQQSGPLPSGATPGKKK
jgi:hypothetical protein